MACTSPCLTSFSCVFLQEPSINLARRCCQSNGYFTWLSSRWECRSQRNGVKGIFGCGQVFPTSEYSATQGDLFIQSISNRVKLTFWTRIGSSGLLERLRFLQDVMLVMRKPCEFCTLRSWVFVLWLRVYRIQLSHGCLHWPKVPILILPFIWDLTDWFFV